MSKVIACITTRNEADSIGDLVRELRGQGLEVVLVDDASADDTPMVAHWAGADVATHMNRLGIGPSMREAWLKALYRGAERVVQIDAGGSHDAGEVPLLLAVEADVVIGSRFRRDSLYIGRPWRALLSRIAAAACNWAQPGARWSDWTSGYRAFTAGALRRLLQAPYYSDMHGWQLEVLARAGEMGLFIAEVPITYRAGRSAFSLRIAWEAFLAWTYIVNHCAARKAEVSHS